MDIKTLIETLSTNSALFLALTESYKEISQREGHYGSGRVNGAEDQKIVLETLNKYGFIIMWKGQLEEYMADRELYLSTVIDYAK